MKKFKFDCGQVVAEVKKEKFTKNKIFMITFIGHGLWGWGISKQVNRADFSRFNFDVAKAFAEQAAAMLSV